MKGQPNKMTINKAGTLPYAAEDESDTVDVIDLNPVAVVLPEGFGRSPCRWFWGLLPGEFRL